MAKKAANYVHGQACSTEQRIDTNWIRCWGEDACKSN